MITIESLSTQNSGNPFLEDHYHMGVTIGSNVTVMMENFSSEKCKYLIVVNTETGERVKVSFATHSTLVADLMENVSR